MMKRRGGDEEEEQLLLVQSVATFSSSSSLFHVKSCVGPTVTGSNGVKKRTEPGLKTPTRSRNRTRSESQECVWIKTQIMGLEDGRS